MKPDTALAPAADCEAKPEFATALCYDLIDTTIRLAKDLVVVRVTCEPSKPPSDPSYRVLIDQSKLLASGKSVNKDYALELLNLGLQSSVAPVHKNETTGTLRITAVDPGVELGRDCPKDCWKWTTAVAAQPCDVLDDTMKLSSEIEPALTDDQKVYIRCKEDSFALTLVHQHGKARQKYYSEWCDRQQPANLYPGGSNVPPPVPPGSSVN